MTATLMLSGHGIASRRLTRAPCPRRKREYNRDVQRKYREKQKTILANKEEKLWQLAGQVKALETEKVRLHRNPMATLLLTFILF